MKSKERNEKREDVGKLISIISHQMKRRRYFPKDEDDLTNMQKRVLHYIMMESLCRDIYQRDLEKEFQIRRSTATGVLQLLEKRGFICRESVEQDARLKKIVPTLKAQNIREKILENIQMMETLLKEGIPQEEMEICIKVLKKMSENLLGEEKKKGDKYE